MAEAGFTDAYRQARPNPLTDPGRTWTPRSAESWQDRIDYVYYNGQHMRCHAAEVLEHHPDGWPSDHAGVLATLQLT
jgi:endonuclease/exonuclease/phosphatase family metal-dependent hydrolase